MTYRVVRGAGKLGAPLFRVYIAPCLSKSQYFTFSATRGAVQHNVRHRRGLFALNERPNCSPEAFNSSAFGPVAESLVGAPRCRLVGAPTLVAGDLGRFSGCVLRTPHSSLQRRFVARVKVHRFAGVVPLKVRSPKSEWYIQAEKEFLSERDKVPEGYIERWREEDLASLHVGLRNCLSLRCASSKQLHQWRKLQLCRQLQRRPFDTGSSAVQIACLTEKILNARQHLLRHRRDHSKKRILSIWLARRQRVMKYLYRTDFDLYKLTCNLLRIKCVHFAIPDSRDRQRAISPVAIDGDRCKFLIRQRLWKGRYRPRPVKQAEGKTVRYTRHVMEQPPPGWNMPHETKPRISRAWPYGVKEERLKGEYTIPNPTAAGIGYCPVPLFF